MSVAITIREARPQDAEALLHAEREWAVEPGYLVSQPEELSVESFRKKIESLNDRSSGKYIVAELDGKIIAHAMLDPMGLQAIRHVFRLTIVVHRGFESQGVGGVMMDHLIDWAKACSEVEKIELNVRSTNTRALRLYRAKGFVQEGVLKKRIKTKEGEYIDELLLGLMVDGVEETPVSSPT